MAPVLVTYLSRWPGHNLVRTGALPLMSIYLTKSDNVIALAALAPVVGFGDVLKKHIVPEAMPGVMDNHCE